MNIGITTHNIIKENVFTKIRKNIMIELFNLTLTNKEYTNVPIKNIIHHSITNVVIQNIDINITL